MGERIVSIEFEQDGDEYTATVGKELEVRKFVRKNAMRDHQVMRGMLITDIDRERGVTWSGDGHGWHNPFLFGQPTRITYDRSQ